MKVLIWIVAVCLLSVAQAAPTPPAIPASSEQQRIPFLNHPKIAQLFQAEKVRGTFVLYDLSQQRWVGYDQQRAQTRYSPASTFKITNSLIGLATGAVSSVDDVFFHYQGQEVYLPSWAQDMSLREAIKVSNVLAYQDLARKIGARQMQSQLTKLQYGNAQIGTEVDQFWLNGDLKISAQEQTLFLARLAQGQLSYSAQQQAAVRDIALLEQGQGWKMYGKTGWTGRAQPSTGWFVGWVEQAGKTYSFALNMDMSEGVPLSKRIDLAKQSLRSLALLGP
ncbi:class D beta-lactamase [Chitinibacter bivalviorum]|uniref:Class D beta-lactamase n=1 Tax=Chitinibacter bivalviorum TaxID=2739434 RepID=A0A7H9BM73_9NEIS|nr:class D beta-lactamase [Chitinibacter bivalviorum]QLG89552.1 class D beta-lactamase [Chitinibacter bivalviorum]